MLLCEVAKSYFATKHESPAAVGCGAFCAGGKPPRYK